MGINSTEPVEDAVETIAEGLIAAFEVVNIAALFVRKEDSESAAVDDITSCENDADVNDDAATEDTVAAVDKDDAATEDALAVLGRDNAVTEDAVAAIDEDDSATKATVAAVDEDVATAEEDVAAGEEAEVNRIDSSSIMRVDFLTAALIME